MKSFQKKMERGQFPISWSTFLVLSREKHHYTVVFIVYFYIIRKFKKRKYLDVISMLFLYTLLSSGFTPTFAFVAPACLF